jgi:murein DD-endopeptidase MepM/ murein hydrolase activator NlpD
MSFGLVFVLVSDGSGAKQDFAQALVSGIINATLGDDEHASPENVLAAAAAQDTDVTPAVNPAIFKSEEEKNGLIRRTLVVGRGQTLTSSLVAAGVSRTELFASLDAMRTRFNPHDVKAGQNVVVLFKRDAGAGTQEHFVGLELQVQPTQQVAVLRDQNSFHAELKAVVPERRRFAMRGRVDDTLYESGLRAGIPDKVLSTIIKTYSHNTDFQRDIHSGDHFEVLFEQDVDGQGQGVGEPVLIYAALDVRGSVKPIYRVAMPTGGYEYFDADGQSIRKGLLRTPVEGAHLTSGFGMRRHPLLGFSRMHKGVDFGAAPGTPIYAAGAGIVEDATRKSGYGLYVKIRHSNRVSSAYAHMSHFGRGITRGTRVSQGDIIGYVGTTGVTTGPHLHYEVLVENNQVNPLTVDIPTNTTLAGTQLAAFNDWRNKVHNQFEQLIALSPDKTKVAQNTVSGIVSAIAKGF